MADVLTGSNDKEKFDDLCSRTYKAQAIWFLNGFWDRFSDAAENVWSWVHTFGKLDLEKGNDGSGLDELNAHRFLEQIGETKTVRELREALRSSGAIGQNERPKLVPLVHFLVVRFQVDWHELVNSIQGNREEIEKAEANLREVMAALNEAEARAGEARRALAEAQNRENQAKAAAEEARAREAEASAREQEAREREAPFKAAQEELEAAVAELKAQEDAYNSKTEELKAKSEGAGVAAMRAKNELAQHLGEDPLPLRRAKITQEAALKKAEKFRAPFEAATREAEAARLAATQARQQSDEAANAASKARQDSETATAAAEAAREAAKARVVEAEEYLEEIKKRQPEGAMWWLERELHEAKAYLPQAKGGYKKQDLA